MIYSQQHYGAGRPDCGLCGGVGYVSFNVPMEDPRFGKAVPCECIAHPEGQIIDELRRAGIPDPQAVIGREMNWSVPGQGEMAEGVRQFLARQVTGEGGGQMALVSPFGCGKTTLAEWLVWQCRLEHKDALYVTAERFKEAVAQTFDGGNVPALIGRIKNARIVVMDQIDWIRETVSGGNQSYTAEILRDVFDFRYRQRRELATVFVVNLDAWTKGGEGALDAIYDRMKEGEVFIMRTKGIRAALGHRETRSQNA